MNGVAIGEILYQDYKKPTIIKDHMFIIAMVLSLDVVEDVLLVNQDPIKEVMVQIHI